MAWDGNYFGPEGDLERARKVYRDSKRTAADNVRFASAQYSAANSIAAEVLRCKWSGIRRIRQMFSLASQAVLLVDQAWVKQNLMTTYWSDRLDEVDVSCAVWLQWGWLRGGRKAETQLTLRSVSWQNRFDVPHHTQAFLLMHAIQAGMNHFDDEMFMRLEILASKTAAANPHQAIRVYKKLAHLLPKGSDERHIYQHNAEQLARNANSPDQLKKLLAGV